MILQAHNILTRQNVVDLLHNFRFVANLQQIEVG